jgi:hypothetical protein
MPARTEQAQTPGWHWRETQEGGTLRVWHGEEPREPQVGQGWFDEKTHCLYVWDGDEWVCVAAD